MRTISIYNLINRSVGFCILNKSKSFTLITIIYRKNVYFNVVNFCTLETDSLIYLFFVDYIYKYIKEDIHKFGTSDYLPDNVYQVLQDENKRIVMVEFIGLRMKTYPVLLLPYILYRRKHHLQTLPKRLQIWRNMTKKHWFWWLFAKPNF